MSTPSNIVKLFLDQVPRHLEKVAIIENDQAITYEELRIEVLEYAGHLSDQGLQRGDRVLVFVPVSIKLYKVVLALMAVGAVPVFLDQWSNLKRLKKAAEIADCNGVVAGKKLRLIGSFIRVFRKIPLKISPDKKGHALNSPVTMNPDDAALITFTTGSSGIPKAAWRSHEYLYCQHTALIKELKPNEGDVNMTTLPVFVFSNLAAGLTTILPEFNPKKPEQLKPEIILKPLERATTLICSPDFLMRLLAKAPEFKLAHLKVFTGGAPVSPQMAIQIEKSFSQALVAYGSTEAEPISSISIAELAAYGSKEIKGIPVGGLHPDIQMKIIGIVDEVLTPNAKEFEEMCISKNGIGEIVVSGPHVLKKYFKNPEAQKRQKFDVNNNLWHRTGDAGFITENGQVFLVGPSKYLFKENNHWVCQFSIEIALAKLKSIKEGTILFKKNKNTLFIAKEVGYSQSQVEADLLKSAIPHEQIEYLQNLPKDPRHHSKIEYHRLMQ